MRLFMPRFSAFSLLLGLLFLSASLTPSLIPRGPIPQGVLGGVVMALGYLSWQIVMALWSAADMPVLRGRARKLALVLSALFVLVSLGTALRSAYVWQDDLRLKMGLDALSEAHLLKTLAIVAVVFLLMFLLGVAVASSFRWIRARLDRYVPRRRANVLGVLIVAAGLFVLTRDGLLDATVRFLDETYEATQNLFDDAPPAPTGSRFAGSPESLVDWAAMGQPGRDFITTGPDAAAIAAFTGRPALDPIRVYVGRADGETAEARADLALAELLRLDAFSRKVLVVVSPTGTGWMDPGSSDPLEYMHDGDIATVSVQYSYLQSPFALMFETETGLKQATATLARVHDHWKTLPEESRPRLYVHGLSLGAWSSMYSTNLFRLVDDPIDGAFWVGPPFPSNFWNQVQRARVKGSPWVKPIIGDGSFIRYAGRGDDGSEGAAPWGDMRIMFLQYPSDPIVFYEPLSIWRRPEWMREPPGDGVSSYMSFMPIVTQFQLALDMAMATSAPAGFGHGYYAQDYIQPWVQVTAPEQWTPEDTERLKAHCDNGFQKGCTNR